jgi:CheY-like chemotaxis protein
MHAEILVVDDDGVYAKNLAEWLQSRMPQRVAHTDRKDEAIELVKSTYVRVAVLDQRMRHKLGVDGTELAAEIQTIDERVRVIILSGESDVRDYQKSNELRLRHLVKGDDEALLREIRVSRQQYLLDLERKAEAEAEVIGRYRPWTVVRGPSVIFKKLLEEYVSPVPEVDEKDFRTLVHVNAGQSVTEADTGTFSYEIEIEEESTRQLEATGLFRDVIIAQLTASLKSAIRERGRMSITRQEQHASEQRFQVPEKDQAQGVVAYAIQEAPLYRRKRALIQVSCECCGHQDIVTVGFREPSGQIQRRRIDYLTGDQQRITNIGKQLSRGSCAATSCVTRPFTAMRWSTS